MPAISSRDDAEGLDRLLQVMKTRLTQSGGGPAVYPVGLVNDGAQMQTTHHLQRELSYLQERHRIAAFSPTGALWSYLSGQSATQGRKSMLGLFANQGLTVDQRDVCESFLGSTLTAVQGHQAQEKPSSSSIYQPALSSQMSSISPITASWAPT